MNKFSRLFFMLLTAAVFIPTSASAAKFDFGNNGKLDLWGLVQMQGNVFDYPTGHDNEDQDGLQFDAERVRFGAKYTVGSWELGTQFDGKDPDHNSNDGSLNDFVRDAYGKYKFSDAFQVKFGQFKMPNGMSYTMSGTRLPLVERTMASRLVINRALGAMISGRNIGGNKETGGFGYDFALANPADRSAAYVDNEERDTDAGADTADKGDDYTYVGRLIYDYGKRLHLQASYGVVENAGSNLAAVRRGDAFVSAADNTATTSNVEQALMVAESEDYEVMDIGMTYKRGPMRIRAEYIDGSDVRGIKDNDEQVWFLEGGYRFNDMMEGVVRYQDAECDGCGSLIANTNNANTDLTQDLSRFEVGMNFFLGQNDRNGRVQLYYASVGGDEEEYSGRAGRSNFNVDQLAVQLQMRF